MNNIKNDKDGFLVKIFKDPYKSLLSSIVLLLVLGITIGRYRKEGTFFYELTEFIRISLIILFVVSIIRIIISIIKNNKQRINIVMPKNVDFKKIGNVLMIGICVFCIFSLININNNSKKDTPTESNEEDADLVKCSEKGYFISKLQSEIYDREGSSVTINITNCSSSTHGDGISVKCDYTRTWNNSYETNGNITKKRVDKLFHTNQYPCKNSK